MPDSKFTGLFQNVTPENSPRERSNQEAAPATRPLGRPPGKRSHPDWKQFSVFLRRQNQRKAASILRDRDDPLDLSGLLDSLLAEWLKKQG